MANVGSVARWGQQQRGHADPPVASSPGHPSSSTTAAAAAEGALAAEHTIALTVACSLVAASSCASSPTVVTLVRPSGRSRSTSTRLQAAGRSSRRRTVSLPAGTGGRAHIGGGNNHSSAELGMVHDNSYCR